MAVLYLKGRKEPMTIGNDRAKKLKDDWLSDKLPARIDLGEAAIDAKDIKGIEKIYEGKEAKPYTDDELKEFQTEFLKWKAKNNKEQSKAMDLVDWLVSMGFAKWKEGDYANKWYDHTITDTIMYQEYMKKFTALEFWRYGHDERKE